PAAPTIFQKEPRGLVGRNRSAYGCVESRWNQSAKNRGKARVRCLRPVTRRRPERSQNGFSGSTLPWVGTCFSGYAGCSVKSTQGRFCLGARADHRSPLSRRHRGAVGGRPRVGGLNSLRRLRSLERRNYLL